MFGGKNKVIFDKDLFEKVRRVAELAGYASPEEFIVHCVEKEMVHFEGDQSDADITEKLRGLGYIS
jgi:hypothetical protein